MQITNNQLVESWHPYSYYIANRTYMKKYAKATWNGSGFEGNGTIDLQSQTLVNALYTFNSRFNTVNGTNSEELLAAAHASDFTMKLSFILTEAGYMPQELITTCYINFDKGELTSSTLDLIANVAGITPDLFNEYVKEANEFCPITRVLNLKILIRAKLLTVVNVSSEINEFNLKQANYD